VAKEAKVKQENLEEKEKALEAINAKHRKSRKPALLTKREKKRAGNRKRPG